MCHGKFARSKYLRGDLSVAVLFRDDCCRYSSGGVVKMQKKNGRGELTGIVKIALVLSVLTIGLTPLASAGLTITITPGIADCVWKTYTVEITSPCNEPWSWQNTSMPTEIRVEDLVPTAGGVQLVRTDFWNCSKYVGHVIIKSNTSDPTGSVDVFAMVTNGDVLYSNNTQSIDYTQGAVNVFTSPFPGGESKLVVKWPTDTEEGWANVSLSFMHLTNITDQYTLQLCCPPGAEQICFKATSSSDPDGDVFCIDCAEEVPVYNAFGLAAVVGIMGVVLGFATLRRKKRA